MPTTIIQHARLFDGREITLDSATVILGDARIAWVGHPADAPRADGAVIDGRGCTLLPGLIDCHMHLFMGGSREAHASDAEAERAAATQAIIHARRCLETGVTAVRDLGSRWGRTVIDLAAAIERGELSGPEVIAAGRFIAPMAGYMAGVAREAASPEDAAAAAREQVADGARVLKAIASPVSPHAGERPVSDSFGYDALHAIAEVAHAAGFKMTAHAHGLAGARDAVRAGADCIEHGYRLDEATVGEMARRGTWLVPTMVAMEASQAPQWAPGRPDDSARRARERWEAAVQALNLARTHSVRVATGTDAFGIVPVESLSREVRLLVESGGYTPAEALRAATADAAELLDIDAHTGRIAQGMRADLLLVEGDPLSDVDCLERIRGVWSRGQRVR